MPELPQRKEKTKNESGQFQKSKVGQLVALETVVYSNHSKPTNSFLQDSGKWTLMFHGFPAKTLFHGFNESPGLGDL